MTAAITLDTLRSATSEEFPVIDLGPYRHNPRRYPPITYREYRVWWLNTNYGANLSADKILARRA